MEIVLEALRGELISKSRWEKDEKRGKFFFLISLGGTKERGRLTCHSIFTGGGGEDALPQIAICCKHFLHKIMALIFNRGNK